MIEVRQSAIEGRGAFAAIDFSQADPVHVLSGERLSLTKCAVRILTRKLRWDDPLQIGKHSYLALDDVSVAFNHSCEANCGMRGESELFALRPIAIGDELTYDYSMTVRPGIFTKAWSLACNCGSARCRGTVGNFDSVPADVLKFYVEAGAIPTYMNDLIEHAERP